MLGACNSTNKNESVGTGNTDSTKTSVNTFDTTRLSAGAAFYQCPMDKEEISDKPGTCSKCGMDLEKVVKS